MSLSELNAVLAERIQNTPNDPHVLDVELSAGFMSLMVWSDFLRVTKDERDFVFWLGDMMRAFEANGRMFPEPPAAPATLDELRANAKTQQGEPVAPVEPIPGLEPDSFAGESVADGPGAGWDTHAETPTAGENPAPVAVIEVAVSTRKPLDLALRTCHECGVTAKGEMGLAAHRRHRHSASPTAAVAPSDCVHVWELGTPIGDTVHGKCRDCGALKDFPSDPLAGGSAWRPSTGDRPNCPSCGKRPSGDKHGYWCNDCQKAVAS